jgi:hypothetical protein
MEEPHKLEILKSFSIAILIERFRTLFVGISGSSVTLTSKEVCDKLNNGLDLRNDHCYNLYVTHLALRHALGDQQYQSYLNNIKSSIGFEIIKSGRDQSGNNSIEASDGFSRIDERRYVLTLNEEVHLGGRRKRSKVEKEVDEFEESDDADNVAIRSYYELSRAIKQRVDHIRQNISNKFVNIPEIDGLGYFANKEELLKEGQILALQEQMELEQQQRDLNQNQQPIDVSPEIKKKIILPYSLWWTMIPDELRTVIDAIRNEMGNAFDVKDKTDRLEETNDEHTQKLQNSYNNANILCPTLMNLIMGIIISTKSEKLFNTQKNEIKEKLGELDGELRKHMVKNISDSEANLGITLTLLQYASLGGDLLKEGVAKESIRDGKNVRIEVLNSLEQYKRQSTLIYNLIMNSRFKGKMRLIMIEEVSRLYLDGGLSQRSTSCLCKLHLSNSASKLATDKNLRLNEFVQVSFNELKIQAASILETTPNKEIEIPQYIFAAIVDNYVVPNWAPESVLYELFTNMVTSLTIMYRAIKLVDYLRKCAANNKTPVAACVPFDSSKIDLVKAHVRNTEDIRSTVTWSCIDGIVDTKFAHLRDFNMLPSLPVKSGNHAHMIQVFDILGNKLLYSDGDLNNRFVLWPNDPEFTYEAAKFAASNYNTVRNCVLTPPPFHLSKHMVESMAYNPAFMLILFGPLLKAVDFKPSIFRLFNQQQMNLKETTAKAVADKKMSSSSAVAVAPAEVANQIPTTSLKIVISKREIEKYHARLHSEELGYDSDDGPVEDEQQVYEDYPLNNNNDDKSDDDNFSEGGGADNDDVDDDDDDDDSIEKALPSIKAPSATPEIVAVLCEIIERRKKTRQFALDHTKLSTEQRKTHKLDSSTTNMNIKEAALMRSAVVNHKRLLFYTNLLYFVVLYAEDDNNSNTMLTGLDLSGLSSIKKFTDLYEANRLTQVIKNTFLNQLKDSVEPFVKLIRDGDLKPLLMKMPDFIMYFSCSGRPNIVKSCIFLYAELLWLQDQEHGRPDILKLIAENITFLNEVLIEFRHSTMAHKLPRNCKKTFQMIRNVSILVSKTGRDYNAFKQAFNDLVKDDNLDDNLDEESEKEKFKDRYKTSSESVKQILQFDKLGKQSDFIQLVAVNWYRHLILSYAKMTISDDTVNQSLFEYKFLNPNTESPEHGMMDYYFNEFSTYITNVAKKDTTNATESMDIPLTSLTKFLLGLKKDSLYRIVCALRDLGQPKEDITYCIEKCNKTLSAMKIDFLIFTIDYCLTKTSTVENRLHEDDAIDYLKTMGPNLVPPIIKWPDDIPVASGAKLKKTSTTNLEQYLDPNLPPINEIEKMLSEMEWSDRMSFPLTADMRYIPNPKITRDSQNQVRKEKLAKKQHEMLIVDT